MIEKVTRAMSDTIIHQNESALLHIKACIGENAVGRPRPRKHVAFVDQLGRLGADDARVI
jgi:hypothetical protein